MRPAARRRSESVNRPDLFQAFQSLGLGKGLLKEVKDKEKSETKDAKDKDKETRQRKVRVKDAKDKEKTTKRSFKAREAEKDVKDKDVKDKDEGEKDIKESTIKEFIKGRRRKPQDVRDRLHALRRQSRAWRTSSCRRSSRSPVLGAR